MAWLDTGTYNSCQDASSLAAAIETTQGLEIGFPEEMAHLIGWIDMGQRSSRASRLNHNGCGEYLSVQAVGRIDSVPPP